MPPTVDKLRFCGDQLDPEWDERASQLMAQAILAKDKTKIDPISGIKFSEMTPEQWAQYVAQQSRGQGPKSIW
jgi:hypothetical protein